MEFGRKLKPVIIGSLILLFLGTQPCMAVESNEELDVYNNFFTVTGTEAQYNQMLDIMMSQFQQGFSAGIQDTVQELDEITAKEKGEIKKIINESMGNYLQTMKSKILEIMPFQELVENVYVPVYRKHFTLDEIKEITIFYKGELGQKFVSLTPTIMQESVGVINQNYNQKIMQATKETAESELFKIKRAIEELEKK